MIRYNIYYKNEKVNIKPLSKEQINEIISNNVIYKKAQNNDLIAIPINKIKIFKCTII